MTTTRRSFLTTVGAAFAALSLPFKVSASQNEVIANRVLESFPLHKSGMFHVLKTVRNSDDSSFSIRIDNIVDDVNDKLNIWVHKEEFMRYISDEVVELDRFQTATDNYNEAIVNIVRAANRIALHTRRGAGNHYAVLEDGTVLVWYKGSNHFDTPIVRSEHNVYFNENYRDYFRKVTDITLTDSVHEKLASIGYTRIT